MHNLAIGMAALKKGSLLKMSAGFRKGQSRFITFCSHANTHAGIICIPYGKLSAKHKEKVLMLVVRLNGGRGDSNIIAAVSKELMELDMGDWHEVADVARHLMKQDYNADSAKLQIIVSPKLDFLRNFWQTKANKLLPLLVVAANKLLSAHTASCAAERNWSAWGRIYTSLRNKLDLETAEKLVYVKAN